MDSTELMGEDVSQLVDNCRTARPCCWRIPTHWHSISQKVKGDPLTEEEMTEVSHHIVHIPDEFDPADEYGGVKAYNMKNMAPDADPHHTHQSSIQKTRLDYLMIRKTGAHRFIAFYKLGLRPDVGYTVDHGNRNVMDNTFQNISYQTHSGQMRNADLMGRPKRHRLCVEDFDEAVYVEVVRLPDRDGTCIPFVPNQQTRTIHLARDGSHVVYNRAGKLIPNQRGRDISPTMSIRSHGKRQRNYQLHRLLWANAYPDDPMPDCVAHKNGKISDWSLDNLVGTTQSGVSQLALDAAKTVGRGKLKVTKCRLTNIDSQTTHDFPSLSDAARWLIGQGKGKKVPTVCANFHAMFGGTQHTAYGFTIAKLD